MYQIGMSPFSSPLVSGDFILGDSPFSLGPFPSSRNTTPRRPQEECGIVHLLTSMSSHKTKSKCNFENDSIFNDDIAAASSGYFPSNRFLPPQPNSINKVFDDIINRSNSDIASPLGELQPYKYRRRTRNGFDDQFDRLTCAQSSNDDCAGAEEQHQQSHSSSQSTTFPPDTPVKKNSSLATGGPLEEVVPMPSSSPPQIPKKKKRNADSLLTSHPSPTAASTETTSVTSTSRMVTRNRNKAANVPSSPIIQSSTLGGHGSPVDHSPTTPGYMSPGPEKSTKNRNSLPCHPSSCSPYRTRSQARSSAEVIPPITFPSEEERKEIRYTTLPSCSLTDHCSYSTDHEEFSLTNNSMNETPNKNSQYHQHTSFLSSSSTSPFHHPISPCDDDQLDILQSLISPTPKKNYPYRGAMNHSGNSLAFGSPTPAERTGEPRKVLSPFHSDLTVNRKMSS